MGSPRQEFWLKSNLHQTGARFGVGVGAFLDFASGTIPRAPRWMQSLGAEWLFRLSREPRRLAHRYICGNPRFVLGVCRESAYGPYRWQGHPSVLRRQRWSAGAR
jgi:UDP-N-acetyl-D-mannosaminuronic acid transferase (WecB/TagA/CpsF family)